MLPCAVPANVQGDADAQTPNRHAPDPRRSSSEPGRRPQPAADRPVVVAAPDHGAALPGASHPGAAALAVAGGDGRRGAREAALWATAAAERHAPPTGLGRG